MSARYRLAALVLALFAVAAVSLQAAASEIRQKPVDWPIADVKPPPPMITEPASEGGRANPRDCPDGICDLEGTGPPNALVYVYRKLEDSLPIIGQPHGPRVDIARTDAGGRWRLPGVRLLAGNNVLVAVADVDGVRSSSSTPLNIAYYRTDAYGGRFEEKHLDLPLGEVFDFISYIDTRDSAKGSAETLDRVGYESSYWLNEPASTAASYLAYDTVFSFNGHGANNSLYFESDGQSSYLEAYQIRNRSLSPMRLAVLVGCGTGRDISAPDSIVAAFFDQGADTVIGFKHTLYDGPANYWSEQFWTYVSQQKEVQDAARQAAQDTRARFWLPGLEAPQNWQTDGPVVQALAPNSLAIVSRRDVYLVPAPGSASRSIEVQKREALDLPSLKDMVFRDWFEQWSAELGEHIRDWLDEQRIDLGQQLTDWWEEQRASLEEKGADWWAEQKEDLGKKVTEWWEQQQEELARLLEEELERKVNELCGGSASIGLMIVAAVLSSHRHNRRRR
jgi:hypothetical protein